MNYYSKNNTPSIKPAPPHALNILNSSKENIRETITLLNNMMSPDRKQSSLYGVIGHTGGNFSGYYNGQHGSTPAYVEQRSSRCGSSPH